MTITEALTEVNKTLPNRIQKQREFINAHLGRPARVVDALEAEGGSPQAIDKAFQTIRDLQARMIQLRTAIQQANFKTKVKVGDEERTIAEWLVFRKEVLPLERVHLDNIFNNISRERREHKVYNADDTIRGLPGTEDIIVHIRESELTARRDQLEKVSGELDGKLTLFNSLTQLEGVE